MEQKKNPKLELKKNSVLYFSIGMTAVLLLAYVALEWKIYDTSPYDNPICLINPDVLDEEVPITFHTPPPQPPKIQTPPVIEIVSDEKEIVETMIESNEPDQETEIMDIEDIDFAKEVEPVTVPWVLIQDVPVFPGCENEEDKRACFQEMMQKHIRKNFKYPENAVDMNLQGKVFTQFTIQKDGSIGEVRMRGPHKILEGEAARIIAKLPKMTPGKQRGTPVKVPFSIPITFKLQ